MTVPTLSIVVPVLDEEEGLDELRRRLRAALEGISHEIVFVDDGSTDGSAAIAQSYEGLRYVHKENGGLAAARNTGLAHATGEFLAYLDDDDILLPDKLSRQVAHLLEHPETGCVLGRQEIMLEPGVEPPDWLTRDTIYGDLDGIPLVSAMIRTEVLRRVGGFDETYRFAEDRDLFVRLREHGVEIAVLPDIVLKRRFHGENMNFRMRPAKHPLLRSLKAKIDRERAAAAGAAEAEDAP